MVASALLVSVIASFLPPLNALSSIHWPSQDLQVFAIAVDGAGICRVAFELPSLKGLKATGVELLNATQRLYSSASHCHPDRLVFCQKR